MIFGTFQGWGLLAALALGALMTGVLAARHRWARWVGLAMGAFLVLGLVVLGILIWRSEGEDRLIGQAAFLVLFLPAGAGLGLLFGTGFLLGRGLGGGSRSGSRGRT